MSPYDCAFCRFIRVSAAGLMIAGFLMAAAAADASAEDNGERLTVTACAPTTWSEIQARSAQEVRSSAIAPPRMIPRHGRIAQAPTAISGQKGNPAIQPALFPLSQSRTPSPSANFNALDDDGTAIPPDTNGTVGPNHVMVALNSQVLIQQRNGTAIGSPVTLNTWWSGLGASAPDANPNAFDPHLVYDQIGGRWIFVASADNNLSTSEILLAVSATSDPTGSWSRYAIRADSGGTRWADYPCLGFSKNWIVVSVNLFTNSTDAFVRSDIYAFPRATVETGPATVTFKKFSDVNGFTDFPAVTMDPNLSTQYLVDVQGGTAGPSGQALLRISSISGAIGSEIFSIVTSVATPNSFQDGPPSGDFEPQAGTTVKIDGGDSRMINVVYRNGSLWCAHDAYLPATGTPTRTAVQWYQMLPSGILQQVGRIDDASNTNNYSYGSIAVNQFNQVLIGFNTFSSSIHPTASYAFREPGDASGTMQAPVTLKSGIGVYDKNFGGSSVRWGDYSTSMVDPVNDSDFWTIQEYSLAKGASAMWGTWWGKVPGRATVANVTSTLSNGTYKAGQVIDVQVTFTLPVTVTNTPQLQLATGSIATANYLSGSGSSTLTFRFTTAAGMNTLDLDCLSPILLNGGTINDGTNPAGLALPIGVTAGSLASNRNIVIDTIAPTVSNVTSTAANGAYAAGTIPVTVSFSESVTVTGTPTLTLGTTPNEVVSYTGGSGTSTLTFNYTIISGDHSPRLDYLNSGALLLAGGTIMDAAGNAASLTLASPGATGSLGANKSIVIGLPVVTGVNSVTANGTYHRNDVISIQVVFSAAVTVLGGPPQLTLATTPNAAVVNYSSGSGTNTLTFTYTVGVGQSSPDLDELSANALTLNGGTIRDGSGNDAVLTLPAPGQANSLGSNKALVVAQPSGGGKKCGLGGIFGLILLMSLSLLRVGWLRAARRG